MIDIPDTYFEQKFDQHAGDVTRKSNGVLNGGCPFCLEGSSWGRKKRMFYYPDRKIATCFNCGIVVGQVNFIMKLEGLSFTELLREVRSEGGEFYSDDAKVITVQEELEKPTVRLPSDAFNLLDPDQTNFYTEVENDWFVQKALGTIKERRLDTAKYRSDLFMSLTDFVHEKRIIIPFRDEYSNLSYYQSRAQTKKQEERGKYMSCVDGEKSFFGIDKIDYNQKNLFVIEGPLDCFFVGNSIGGGGIKLNQKQSAILFDLEVFFDVVYCLDNDFDNADVVKLYHRYIKEGKRVFMWDDKFQDYKDFNQYAMAHGLDEIPQKEILARSYTDKDVAATRLVENIKRANKRMFT